jgi:hypothetical protein
VDADAIRRSYADAKPRPFWLDQSDAPEPVEPLEGELRADLVMSAAGTPGSGPLFSRARKTGSARWCCSMASGSPSARRGPGAAEGVADPRPPDALDHHAFAALAPGQRYEAALPTGETVSGELWYRSAHQIGLTVDDYGDGPLVLTAKPAALDPPRGSGTVLITTYGLADETLQAVHRRWREWWAAR